MDGVRILRIHFTSYEAIFLPVRTSLSRLIIITSNWSRFSVLVVVVVPFWRPISKNETKLYVFSLFNVFRFVARGENTLQLKFSSFYPFQFISFVLLKIKTTLRASYLIFRSMVVVAWRDFVFINQTIFQFLVEIFRSFFQYKQKFSTRFSV